MNLIFKRKVKKLKKLLNNQPHFKEYDILKMNIQNNEGFAEFLKKLNSEKQKLVKENFNKNDLTLKFDKLIQNAKQPIYENFLYIKEEVENDLLMIKGILDI